MRCLRPALIAAACATALLLTGCAVPSPAPSTTSTRSAAASSTPTPTATPDTAARLILGVDAVTFQHSGGSEVVSLDDGNAVVGLIEQIAGEPAVEEFDGPYESEGGLRYEWDDITISVWSYDSASWVIVDGSTVGDVPIATAEGMTVGSTRDEAISAGAVELCSYDGDGDGKSDSLALQLEEVPDAQSLCRVGSAGVLYVDLGFAGDTVSRLSAPANDFSDI